MSASLHPRHNAIAQIDGHIARAEATRARYLQDLQDLQALPGARHTRVLLLQVEAHLEQLRRSREMLLSGDEGR